MSKDYPVTRRDDVSPEAYTTKKKTMGDSYNEAANAPNNPTKNHQPTSYNTNADYPCCNFHEDGDE